MPMLFDPFEQLREFQRAIDAFRSSGWLGSGLSAGGTYPPMNIFGKGDDIIAIIEVPGCASRISTSGSSAIRCASPEEPPRDWGCGSKRVLSGSLIGEAETAWPGS